MNRTTYLTKFAIGLAFTFGLAHGQAKVSTLSISEPRPLASAADALSIKCGCLINYEDVEYGYAGDLQDVTSQTVSAAFLSDHPGKKILVPRPASILFQFAVNARTSVSALSGVLQQLVAAHNDGGNPGQFTVQQSGSVFNILPARVKDVSGKWVEDGSPFDQRISFPSQTMSGLNAVELICQLVSKSQSKEVGLATVPTNYLALTEVTLSANNEVAREVLIRALAGLRWRDSAVSEPSRKLMWRMYYGPDVQQYGLNIRIAKVEEAAPNGGTVLVNQ